MSGIFHCDNTLQRILASLPFSEKYDFCPRFIFASRLVTDYLELREACLYTLLGQLHFNFAIDLSAKL
jgi:hypothetical protein